MGRRKISVFYVKKREITHDQQNVTYMLNNKKKSKLRSWHWDHKKKKKNTKSSLVVVVVDY